jgi:hypothetical protein
MAFLRVSRATGGRPLTPRTSVSVCAARNASGTIAQVPALVGKILLASTTECEPEEQEARLQERWVATQRVVLARTAARAGPPGDAPGSGATAVAESGRAALLRILDSLAADVARMEPSHPQVHRLATEVAALRGQVEGAPGPGATAAGATAADGAADALGVLRTRWRAARALLSLPPPRTRGGGGGGWAAPGVADPLGALLVDLFEDADALWRASGHPEAHALMGEVTAAWVPFSDDDVGGAGCARGSPDAAGGRGGSVAWTAFGAAGAEIGAAAGAVVTPTPLPVHFRIACAAAASAGAVPDAHVVRVLVPDDLALQM